MINIKKGVENIALSKHVTSSETISEVERFPTFAVIGLGQAGGRIASEIARFGCPIFLINTCKSDMMEKDLKISEERKYLTSCKRFPRLEGTGGYGARGLEIAEANADIYEEIANKQEVRDADFIWVTASLSGGTGSGALDFTITKLIESRKETNFYIEGVRIGVICTLPAIHEMSVIGIRNTLTCIKQLQNRINENEISSVLVIDNEKIMDYYSDEKITETIRSTIDRKTYSNKLTAALLIEISVLPFLVGRSVFDKTSFLSLISTPGWLSISKIIYSNSLQTLELEVLRLYEESDFFVEYGQNNINTLCTAILYPKFTYYSPEIADMAIKYASKIQTLKTYESISVNSAINGVVLYGISVSNIFSKDTIAILQRELQKRSEAKSALDIPSSKKTP